LLIVGRRGLGREARKSKVTLSDFVLEHVSNSLLQEKGEESYKARADFIQQVRSKDEFIEKISGQNKILSILP